jgi:SAM-dependent methyltransferase
MLPAYYEWTMTNDLRKLYGPGFFQNLNRRSVCSASVCVPLIIDLLRPASVIDVGCGRGEWLKVLAASGVADIQGVDGSHVKDEELLISPQCFLRHDLTRALRIQRRYDLAISLEVGEHLPKKAASTYVASLVALAPAVVFSAAVPGQGGVHHVNEQWQWYWKEHFARHGYVQLDPFRRLIWNHGQVAAYYQHNIFLYVDPQAHRALIDQIGVPDKSNELTLIRTDLLQELTGPPRIIRFLARASARLARLFGVRGSDHA